jgi:hypothetical protein
VLVLPLSAPLFIYSRRLKARQGKERKRGSDYYSGQGGSHKLNGYAYRLSTNRVSGQLKGSGSSPHSGYKGTQNRIYRSGISGNSANRENIERRP